MWLEAISGAETNSASCPTCGGHVRRRVYGEMHAGSSLVDGERVERRGVPPAWYADPVVLDALTQYFDGHLYRLWPSTRYFSRGGSRLHRDVWSAVFGPIPDGCHIHHRDGDSAHNAVANLECLPSADHLSREWHQQTRVVHFSAMARSKAADWHRSDAGRLWHQRQAHRSKSWTKWMRAHLPCQHCGTVVSMVVRRSGYSQKYCSETCKALAYRVRHAARGSSGYVVYSRP